ncbi:terminase large subunit [Acetobacter nitrogenifigens]|uniref:Terminase n=1 Tax=Acetobacter nitrogenifigens DSM 23921 = NBRC 105050 TaxID=1120919 RepID=A0A511XFG0_9PROT|nr:terminase TerL endonuclease subunit [Acetobacter nitrogenifigens]GEN61696.1 terminase [Acetobacter nitrogenifigens DSM 23921 = NBRC 105050]
MLNLSRPDWESRLREGQSLLPQIQPVNPALARQAVEIFDMLCIPDVIGQPTFGEAAGDWFRDVVRMLFGALDPATNERQIRELFLLVPKKNSKTTNGAALMMTALMVNQRPNAEFLIVAPTKEIAFLAFNQASGMVRADRELLGMFHIQENQKRLTLKRSGATLSVKAFSKEVMTGVKPAGVLVDEEHVIALNADAGDVMGQIRGGMISQPEAFLAIITTQSDKPPRGCFREDLLQARAIRDGKSHRQGDDGETQVAVGTGILPVIYEFPDRLQKPALIGDFAAWEDPSVWPMVLPNLGRSITIHRLQQEYETARGKGIAELSRWASQHLNVEIGLALRSDRWVGADYWVGAGDDTLTLEEVLARAEVVVAGIDGGGLDDLLSLVVLGRDATTQEWLHWQKSWVFEGVLSLRKKEASVMRDFQAQGDLVIVSEPGDDIEQLADVLEAVDARGGLAQVGLDPQGVGAIVDALAVRGIGRDRVVGVSQGWTLSGAIKTAERKLADGTFRHGARPIMAWAASNAKVEPRGNAIVITKQAAGNLKIDPLMATFNAVTLMSRNPEAPGGKSIYERKSLWAC